jgi:hypothetical protein
MKNEIPSVVGNRVFRELDGVECAAINTQDIIDRLDRMIHDPLFREKVEEMFIKTGRFGPGACFPVLKVYGPLTFKVYSSLEAYRSNEKLPAPFDVPVDIQVGEDRDDQQPVIGGTIKVNREIGTNLETAVDKARLDAGLEVLAPVRNESGYVENKEVPESQSNPKSRKAKSRKVEEAGEEQQS